MSIQWFYPELFSIYINYIFIISRHLSTEIGQEYVTRTEKELSTDDLMALALEIVPFFLKHNAEADAVDLLLELEAIDQLPQYVDKDTYARVCLYMVRYRFSRNHFKCSFFLHY